MNIARGQPHSHPVHCQIAGLRNGPPAYFEGVSIPLITLQLRELGIRGQVRMIISTLLRDPAVRSSRRVTRLVSWPLVVISQLLGLEGKTRVSFLWSAPEADAVVDRYLRGYVLFGRPGGRLAKFEWQSFATRAVTTPETCKVPTRVGRHLRNSGLEVRFDQDFLDIAKACQEGRSGWTWLTDELIDVYGKLNGQGLVGTIGTYRDDRLVGGLFGTTIGRVFCIMSIFHREDHAGSVAMAAAIDILMTDGKWALIDFGNIKPHAERFGAVEVSEKRFLELLQENSGETSRQPARAGDLQTTLELASSQASAVVPASWQERSNSDGTGQATS